MNTPLLVFLIIVGVYVIGITLVLWSILGPETRRVKRLKVLVCMGFVVFVLYTLLLIITTLLLIKYH